MPASRQHPVTKETADADSVDPGSDRYATVCVTTLLAVSSAVCGGGSLHYCWSVLQCVMSLCYCWSVLLCVCCWTTVGLFHCVSLHYCQSRVCSTMCHSVHHCTTIGLFYSVCVTRLLLVCSTVWVSQDYCWSVLLCGYHKTTVGLFYYAGVTRLLLVCSTMCGCLWICVSLYVISALLSVFVCNKYLLLRPTLMQSYLSIKSVHFMWKLDL